MRPAIFLAMALVTGMARAQSADAPAPIPVDAPTPAAAPGADADATAPSAPRIGEIVVTAQRRTQALQDVPIAVTQFSDETLENQDLKSAQDLAASVPGMHVSGEVFASTITIRGIGSDRTTLSGDPGVGLYLDDVFMARTFLPAAAMTDIERVEVLRGPQGTLYGRNTTGGAVKFVSKRPSDTFGGSAELQTGSYDQFVGKGSVTGPLLDDLYFRASAYYETHDGYVHNRTRDEDEEDLEVTSGRVALRWDAAEWISFDLIGDDTSQKQHGPAIYPTDMQYAELLGGTRNNPDDPEHTYSDRPTFDQVDSKGVTLRALMETGIGDSLLVLSQRKAKRALHLDADFTDVPLLFITYPTQAKQTSLELNLGNDTDTPLGTFSWLAGLYGFDEDASETNHADIGQFTPAQLVAFQDILASFLPQDLFIELLGNGGLVGGTVAGQQKTWSYAGFADASLALTPEWIVHAGGRYTVDEREIDAVSHFLSPTTSCTVEGRKNDESSVTFRAGVDWFFAPDRMTYVSFSEGYKAGGFNIYDCGQSPYDPERLDAYEVGFKTQWLDHRLQLNGAAYFYDYTDIQVQKYNLQELRVLNAASARVKGAEIELLAAVLESLTVDGTLSWVDAKFRTFFDDDPDDGTSQDRDLSGNRLTKAPEFSGSLGITHVLATSSWGALTSRFEVTHTGTYFHDYWNHAYAKVKGFEKYNMYFNYVFPDSPFRLQAFGKNLGDKRDPVGQGLAIRQLNGPGGVNYLAPPRTFGIAVGVDF